RALLVVFPAFGCGPPGGGRTRSPPSHSSMARVSGNIDRTPGGDRMTYVDSLVLNLTERLCRRFQTWTGRTNVWLAFQLTNLSIVVYFIWVAGLYWLSGDLAARIFVAS